MKVVLVTESKYSNKKSVDFEIDTVFGQIECDSASTDIESEISERVLDYNL